MTTPTPSEPVELAEPSEETVERVARALCEVLDSGDEDYWATRDCHLALARAAIAAMKGDSDG